MTEPNKYETREAILAMMDDIFAADEQGEDGSVPVGRLREHLRAHTLIPDDKLDLATHEMAQGLDMIITLAAGLSVAVGRNPTHEEMDGMLPSLMWIDDDKGTGTYNITAKDSDGDELAKVTVETKLN